MILRRGDVNNLLGSGVIYWDIVGDNVVVPGYSIFAINFSISPLSIDNKLLTATFPPIPIKTVDVLFNNLKGVVCDIIYAGEMNFPIEEDDLTTFYNKEIDKYNKVIEEYVEVYKDKFETSIDGLSEHEQLNLLQNLSKKMRTEIETQGKKHRLSTRKIVNVIERLYQEKKYDIDNLLSVLFVPGKIGDRLVNLYTRKFFAIYYEDYEQASSLKKEIYALEQTL